MYALYYKTFFTDTVSRAGISETLTVKKKHVNRVKYVPIGASSVDELRLGPSILFIHCITQDQYVL